MNLSRSDRDHVWVRCKWNHLRFSESEFQQWATLGLETWINMDAICSTYVYMKDYKFSQVLLESQEIKSVVRVVADPFFKMMSKKLKDFLKKSGFVCSLAISYSNAN